MQYVRLGKTGLEVSKICLGCMSYGEPGRGNHPWSLGEQDARPFFRRAIEAGINFFDTANVYSGGRAETFLGEVLAGRPRDSYVLATKLYWPMPDGGSGLSREQVHTQLEASLRRLRTDHVDLYQCHRYDWNTPLEETMDALSEVVRQGKARYLGFSEWPEEKIREAQALEGVEHFIASQPQYSMLWRGPEPDVIPASRELGLSPIVRAPLGESVPESQRGSGRSTVSGTLPVFLSTIW